MLTTLHRTPSVPLVPRYVTEILGLSAEEVLQVQADEDAERRTARRDARTGERIYFPRDGQQVLELLAAGCSCKEIARRLRFPLAHARYVRRQLCTYFDAHDATQAVVHALHAGALSLHDCP